MLKANVARGALSVSGEAGGDIGFVTVALILDQTPVVRDTGEAATEVPVTGDGSFVSIVDFSGLVSRATTGAFLYDEGRALSVTGSKYVDYFNLGDLNDSAHGGDGNDTIYGNDGNDRLYGGVGDDALVGGNGNDRLQGSKGNDEINGGAGQDIALFSGRWTDYQIVSAGGGYRVTDMRVGSNDGSDGVGQVEYLHFSDRTLNVALSPFLLQAVQTGSELTIFGQAERDEGQIDVEFGRNQPARVFNDGENMAETEIHGSAWSFTSVDFSGLVNAGGHLQGEGHALSVTGSTFADSFDLGRFDDSAHGSDGNDTISGNDGNDRLYGGIGDDRLNGGSGNDRFQGGKGNDTIDGGAGEDIALYSGRSTDYQFAVVDGAYQITDMRLGSSDGTDLVANVEHIRFSDSTIDLAPLPTLLDATASGSLLTISGEAAHASGQIAVQLSVDFPALVVDNGVVPTEVQVTDEYTYIRALDLSGIANAGAHLSNNNGLALSVTGSNYADYLDLTAHSDNAHGGNGNDTINGNAGFDRLYGGGGDDQLNGGTGNDRFQGGKGNDIIDGGSGEDIALYSGRSTDYHIAVVNGAYQVTDMRDGSSDGADIVSNVERLLFSDQTIHLAEISSTFHG